MLNSPVIGGYVYYLIEKVFSAKRDVGTYAVNAEGTTLDLAALAPNTGISGTFEQARAFAP